MFIAWEDGEVKSNGWDGSRELQETKLKAINPSRRGEVDQRLLVDNGRAVKCVHIEMAPLLLYGGVIIQRRRKVLFLYDAARALDHIIGHC